jgi:hypothetical protein
VQTVNGYCWRKQVKTVNGYCWREQVQTVNEILLEGASANCERLLLEGASANCERVQTVNVNCSNAFIAEYIMCPHIDINFSIRPCIYFGTNFISLNAVTLALKKYHSL